MEEEIRDVVLKDREVPNHTEQDVFPKTYVLLYVS